MGRWQPGARERLQQAALELYSERGYEQTPVAEIAKHAGLTERTFFRHFADKREVLFDGSNALQHCFTEAIAAAPADAPPLAAVAAGLDAVASVFAEPERFAFARTRHAVITATAELRERELAKLDTLRTAVTQALRDRGAPDPEAPLAAQAGLAVFSTAFAHWITDPAAEPDGLGPLMRHYMDVLGELTPGR